LSAHSTGYNVAESGNGLSFPAPAYVPSLGKWAIVGLDTRRCPSDTDEGADDIVLAYRLVVVP
jgi:hypothetical protein